MGACVLLTPLALGISTLPGGSSELLGAIALRWEPAPGPVAGYVVYTSFNDETPFAYTTVWNVASAIVEGRVGDRVRVRVAAIDANWNEGPVSEYSDEILLIAESDTGGDSAAPVPPSEPDPPPDSDPAMESPAPADSPAETPAPDPPTPLDFDGDGFSDLLLRNDATGETRIWVLEGGSVVEDVELPDVLPGWSIVGNGDYDGDGVADVLSREAASGRLDVWLVRDAEVVAQGTIAENPGSSWTVEGSGDHTGDGRADVLLRNRELGQLQLIQVDGVESSRVLDLAAGVADRSEVIGSGDYDGDGLADILWKTASGLELWLIGPSMQIQAVALELTGSQWEVAATGDYDGDGDSDLLFNSGGKLAISAIQGEALSAPIPIGATQVRLDHPALGDCDGDGSIDLLMQPLPVPSGPSVVYFTGDRRALADSVLPALAAGWTYAAVGEQPASFR